MAQHRIWNQEMNQKRIAFIGDSFCATVSRKHWENTGRRQWQTACDTPAWPSLVSEELDLYPHFHGYAGKSWWYSRHHFYQKCKKLLKENQFEVVVFCHTDPTRVNHLAEPLVNVMPTPQTAEEKMLKKAQDLWRGYLYDETFAKWCQNNWLLEIQKKFQHVPKIIQFSNFDSMMFNQYNYLGMCFKTPLMTIQIGEHTGTEKEIWKKIEADYRANHFNERNNITMAELIIDAVNNYNPGLHKIDLSKFYMPNPNAIKYPANNFGTN